MSRLARRPRQPDCEPDAMRTHRRRQAANGPANGPAEIHRLDRPRPDEGEGSEALGPGLGLGGEEHRGGAVGEGRGVRSRSRIPAKARRRAARLFDRDASTSARAMPRQCRIGTSDRLSVRPRSRPRRGPGGSQSPTCVMASLAEAQAQFTVRPGTPGGRPTRSTVSRPRLGAFTEGMTWPITMVPIRPGRPRSAPAARARRPWPGRGRFGRGTRCPPSRAVLLSRHGHGGPCHRNVATQRPFEQKLEPRGGAGSKI
jgi:hypothetical protein